MFAVPPLIPQSLNSSDLNSTRIKTDTLDLNSLNVNEIHSQFIESSGPLIGQNISATGHLNVATYIMAQNDITSVSGSINANQYLYAGIDVIAQGGNIVSTTGNIDAINGTVNANNLNITNTAYANNLVVSPLSGGSSPQGTISCSGFYLVQDSQTVNFTHTTTVGAKQGKITIFSDTFPPILAANTSSYITVNNSSVTSNSLIFLTVQNWQAASNGYPVASACLIQNGSFVITVKNTSTTDNIVDGIIIGYIIV